MKLLRKRDVPEEKYANAFLGFGPEDSHFVVELTYSKFRTVVAFDPNVFANMVLTAMRMGMVYIMHLVAVYCSSTKQVVYKN